MSYSIEEFGTKYTTSYAVFMKNADGKLVSPFHDIPLWADEENGVVNMVCEVPRWSNAKMEIDTGKELNPIIQDTKKGKPRFVHNCFPHHGYIWNYGAIPQTWENPDVKDTHTGEGGDNDPLDICDLSDSIATIGEVKQVKVLGILAMIDEGETDWKVIGMDINDPRVDSLTDVDDLEKVVRGYLGATVEWFRVYKIPAGKPENKFAFDGEVKDKAFALDIIRDTHEQWKKLSTGEVSHEKVSANGTLTGAKAISDEKAAEIVKNQPALTAPAEIPASVNQWHQINLNN